MKKKLNFRMRITKNVVLMLCVINMFYMLILLFNFRVSHFRFLKLAQGVFAKDTSQMSVGYKFFIMWFIISVLAILAGTFLFYLCIGKILKPLENLSKQAEKREKSNNLSEANICSDVKEIDSLIHSFDNMNKKINKRNENQKAFISFFNHEFCNSLAVIKCRINLWQKSFSDSEELCDGFSLINSKITQLTDLITNTCKIIDVGCTSFNKQIPINLVLKEVMLDLEHYANTKNISMKLCYENDSKNKRKFSSFINGNYTFLYEAFYNVIENGIAYNHEGGEVFINVKEDKFMFDIIISDTGCTVFENTQKDMFHPFYHYYKNGSVFFKENSLKLAVSKEVFECHGGSFNLVNLEKGTGFEISLKKEGVFKNCLEDYK